MLKERKNEKKNKEWRRKEGRGGKRRGKAGVKEEREKKRGMSCNKWEKFILSTDFYWMKISVDDLTAKVPQCCYHILPLCQFYNQIQGYKTHVLDLCMQSSVTYIIFPFYSVYKCSPICLNLQVHEFLWQVNVVLTNDNTWSLLLRALLFYFF